MLSVILKGNQVFRVNNIDFVINVCLILLIIHFIIFVFSPISYPYFQLSIWLWLMVYGYNTIHLNSTKLYESTS